MQKIKVGALLVLLLFSIRFYANADEFGSAKISFNDITLDVEYANTFEMRAKGLMFRKSLCADCGMLFRYDSPRIASMWMKNTFIPLDVAFITADGTITDIISMKPHDLTSIRSTEVVQYALEMNPGWFTKRDIQVGEKLTIVATHDPD